MSGGRFCAAVNCFNSARKGYKYTLFKFPKDPIRCQIWVENCGRKDLKEKTTDFLNRNCLLCADHFEDAQFMNPTYKHKLIWNAIPTLFNVPNPPSKITESQKFSEQSSSQIDNQHANQSKNLNVPTIVNTNETVINQMKELPLTKTSSLADLPILIQNIVNNQLAGKKTLDSSKPNDNASKSKVIILKQMGNVRNNSICSTENQNNEALKQKIVLVGANNNKRLCQDISEIDHSYGCKPNNESQSAASNIADEEISSEQLNSNNETDHSYGLKPTQEPSATANKAATITRPVSIAAASSVPVSIASNAIKLPLNVQTGFIVRPIGEILKQQASNASKLLSQNINLKPSEQRCKFRDKSSQTHYNLQSITKQRKTIHSLRVKVCRLQAKLKKIQTEPPKISSKTQIARLLQLSAPFLNPVAYKLFEVQLMATEKKSKGMRWPIDVKKFALDIYLKSPVCYESIRKTLHLPTTKSLSRGLIPEDMHPGFNKSILLALKHFASGLNQEEKLCALVFGEIDLKASLKYNVKLDLIEGLCDFGSAGRTPDIATHALVFMARGIAQEWAQTFAFFYVQQKCCSEVLRTLLLEAVTNLSEVGLTVKAVTCNYETNNINVMDSLEVTLEKPFFEVNGNSVYVMYNPPHLLKLTRNCFQLHRIDLGFGDIASWEHIEKLYHLQNERGNDVTNRFTKDHISLPNSSNQRVNVLAQTLSQSTANGIRMLIEEGLLPQEAEASAKFISTIDGLFDCFNSRYIEEDDTKPLQAPYSLHNEVQTAFLNDCRNCVSLWKFENAENSAMTNCFNGWQLSIRSLLLLCEELVSSFNLDYLLTGRMNLDPIEQLATQFHLGSDCRDRLNCCQFSRKMSSISFRKLLQSNDKSNLDSALIQSIFSTSESTNQSEVSEELKQRSQVIQNSEMSFELLEREGYKYLAWLIAKKVREKQRCPTCIKIVMDQSKNLDDIEEIIERCSSPTDFLIRPSVVLEEACKAMEDNFQMHFEKSKHLHGVVDYMRKQFSQQINFSWLSQHPDHDVALQTLIVKIFIQCKLLHFIKKMNDDTVSLLQSPVATDQIFIAEATEFTSDDIVNPVIITEGIDVSSTNWPQTLWQVVKQPNSQGENLQEWTFVQSG